MQYLLDTHVFLWWISDDRRLSGSHREFIADSSNWIFVSSVTTAEIAIKSSLGKLDAPGYVADAALEGGFELLGFEHSHAERLADLPWIHRDPFDRMLIAQALVEGLTLITADRNVQVYSEQTALRVSR